MLQALRGGQIWQKPHGFEGGGNISRGFETLWK